VSSRASFAVWPWRETEAAAAQPKKTGPARTAVVVQTAVMAAIGAVLFRMPEHRVAGIVAWSLAAVALVSGFFIPPVFAAIERLGRRLGKGAGAILTWSLLAPFYYLCFFPLRLALIIRGRDPLHRQVPTDEPTYWIPRKPGADLSRYKKQF
jgi:hypothetical protein